MSTKKTEVDEVRQRYDRRLAGNFNKLYSPFRPVNVLFRQERERTITDLLGVWLDGRNLAELKIMEIGCGEGFNLLHLTSLGADPENMFANELLAERLDAAREKLPRGVTLLPGDATKLEIADESLDIVFQSTVFSSLLDADFRLKLSACMLRWLKPGGCVLWYDFTYNNPKNPDVVGITHAEIERLFPKCKITSRRVTLAPPIARRLGLLTNVAYPFLNALPLLRTHLVCIIEKQKI